jgi:hypothetical protein
MLEAAYDFDNVNVRKNGIIKHSVIIYLYSKLSFSGVAFIFFPQNNHG